MKTVQGEWTGGSVETEVPPDKELAIGMIVAITKYQFQLLAGETAVIPESIGTLVVPSREIDERFCELTARQHSFREVWVQPDSLPLFGAEPTWAVPDPARDAHLPDVVHECRTSHPDAVGIRHPNRVCRRTREIGDTR